MEYVPCIKTIISEKKDPDEVAQDVNEQVKSFLRTESNVHPRSLASIERVSATQYLLHYYSANR